MRKFENVKTHFPITPQALRMFWMFQRNLGAINMNVEVDQ